MIVGYNPSMNPVRVLTGGVKSKNFIYLVDLAVFIECKPGGL